MKTIEKFGTAKCIDAQPANKIIPYTEWMWRERYMGKIGMLELREFDETEQPYTGVQVMWFSGFRETGDPFQLHTSRGVMERDGNVITYLTKNTKYVFELMEAN